MHRGKNMNAILLNKYYQDVSAEELKQFQDFLRTHELKEIDFNGQSIKYYQAGKGDRAVLISPGWFSTPEYGFRSFMLFEEDFRVIATGMAIFKSLNDLTRAINQILEVEGIKKVVLVGGSASGIMAQAYFKRQNQKVEAMILYNTLAPKKERNKNWALRLIRLLPFSIFRAAVKKQQKKYFKAEIPPEAEARIRFNQALFTEMISTKMNKKLLVSQMKLVFEFNERDTYTSNNFKQWKGRVLVITSEDDPGYKDVDILMKNLPNTELYTFPKGTGHMAPLIHQEEFRKIIKDFLEKL
jgi:pimeloyl-ACP methyl ester carboxylesterase